jgi:hypothetical protein
MIDMSTTKAPPLTVDLPVSLRTGRSPNGRDWVCRIFEGRFLFAETFGNSDLEARESALNVVRAVNSFDRMLEALKAIADHMPKSSAMEGGALAHSSHVRAADKVRAAIALAEGRAP